MAGTDKNYVLGKGKVYFERFESGNVGKGEVYLSQTTEASYSVAVETLDHYDSDEGLNTLDDQVTTKVDVKGKLVTDDISEEKVSMFLLSSGVNTATVAAAPGVIDTFNDVKRGAYYQLGKSAANPSGVRNVTVSKVALASAPTVALAAGTNYVVDAALARVYILPLADAIAENDDLLITYDVAAGTRTQIVSKDKQLRGALRFISNNSVGTNKDFYFPLVNLSPDGDYALKGTEWQKIGFAFTALKLDSTTERVYVDGRAAA